MSTELTLTIELGKPRIETFKCAGETHQTHICPILSNGKPIGQIEARQNSANRFYVNVPMMIGGLFGADDYDDLADVFQTHLKLVIENLQGEG